jgi:chromosome partitioning protein
MPVLSICNHKGGTGKTTTAIHLAAAFGLSGRRVLAVDLDPQGFLTRLLGVEEPDEAQSSLALFDHERDVRSIETIPLRGFELLPASYSMTKAARTLSRPTDVLWVKEALEQGHDYDLVLLDTAAAMTVFSLNALVASDLVLIPVTPEYQPVVGGEQTYSTARLVQDKLNPSLGEPRFLLTQVDARKRDHASYSAYLRETYGERVLASEIRTSASLAESAEGGQTVFDRDIASRGARDYANAADEISPSLFPEAESVVAPALTNPGGAHARRDEAAPNGAPPASPRSDDSDGARPTDAWVPLNRW